MPAVVQGLHYGPGDREAVEGRRAPPDLVEQHQAARRDVVQDRRGLHHLDQERALAPREVVLRADAREHAVEDADPGFARRDEGAHLRHDHDVGRLAQIDRLPRHVRPGEDDDPRVTVEGQVIRCHRGAGARLEHGMPALDDRERVAAIDQRPHVAARVRHLGQRREHVEPGQRAGRRQELVRARRHAPAHVLEQLVLELPTPLVGAERLRFVFFQLGRHVALGAGERLPPHVLGGHARGLRVGHLDAVAEHAVESDPETREPRPGALAFLQPGDPRPRLTGISHEGREPLVPALADHAAVVEGQRRLVLERRRQELAQLVQGRQCGARFADRLRVERFGGTADLGERRQARAQTDEVARVGDPEGRAAGQPFEVADAAQERAQARPLGGRLDQRADRRLARRDRRGVEQRPQEPLAQEASPHRRHRLVQHAEERVPDAAPARLEQLERRDRRLVERQRVRRGQALQTREMAESVALGRAQVRERGRRRPEAGAEVADAEGIQRLDAEVGAEVGRRPSRREGRGIAEGQGRAGRLQARHGCRVRAQRVRHEDLARAPQERGRENLRLGRAIFADPELARRDVDQRDARGVPRGAQRQQKVVRGALEVRGVGEGARRDDPHDAAPQELLLPAGRLELLAHRDLLSHADQARDVGVRRVVGNPGHRRPLARRQRDLQKPGRQLGVLEEGLVEIAQTEEEQVIGIAPLQLLVLLHHRRERVAISQRDGPSAGRTWFPATPGSRARRPRRT